VTGFDGIVLVTGNDTRASPTGCVMGCWRTNLQGGGVE